jgi:outer membrane protein OmpA-like peptidoglycan-associated protein
MATEESTSGLSSSFTDLMTSLAVIFILLLVALVNNKQRELEVARAETDRTQRELEAALAASTLTRKEVLEKLRQELAELAGRGVEVKEDEKDPLGLLVVIPEGLLRFAVDRKDIPVMGVDFLREFIPRLAVGACAFREDLSSILVEGHTDSTAEDEHNLKLSQERSMEVVRQSLVTLKRWPSEAQPREDIQACFLDLLSASGRGERELFLVDGHEDRDRSRRVVFKIRVRSFEQREQQIVAPEVEVQVRHDG